MATRSSRVLNGASAVGLAILLGACEPERPSATSDQGVSLLNAGGPLDWPMDGYGTAFEESGDWSPLPAAVPMVSRVSGDYNHAPEWDYPQDYIPNGSHRTYGGYSEYSSYPDYHTIGYDADFFGESYHSPVSEDNYALLALAAILGGVIGNSPPDYYFEHRGVHPWVWVTGDRYIRYAEPIDSGYRYYYYAPGVARPFLVRDPYYSYGYRGDRLLAIYDSSGRVLDSSRALRLRPAALSYYERGTTLYRASKGADLRGVPAPMWEGRRNMLLADQASWERARSLNTGWRTWHHKHARAATPRWRSERVARRYAAERFHAWQESRYRDPAPRLRHELRSRPQIRQDALARAVVASRRDERLLLAAEHRSNPAQVRDRSGRRNERYVARGERAAVGVQPAARRESRAAERGRLVSKTDGRLSANVVRQDQRRALSLRAKREVERQVESRAEKIRNHRQAALTKKAVNARPRDIRHIPPKVQQRAQKRVGSRPQLQASQRVEQDRQQRAEQRTAVRQQRQAVQHAQQQRQQRAQQRAAVRQQRQVAQHAQQQHQQRAQSRPVPRQQQAAQNVQQQRQQHAQQRVAVRQQRQVAQQFQQQRSQQRSANQRQLRPDRQVKRQDSGGSTRQRVSGARHGAKPERLANRER